MNEFDELQAHLRMQLITATWTYESNESDDNLETYKKALARHTAICAAKAADKGNGTVIAKLLDIERLKYKNPLERKSTLAGSDIEDERVWQDILFSQPKPMPYEKPADAVRAVQDGKETVDTANKYLTMFEKAQNASLIERLDELEAQLLAES